MRQHEVQRIIRQRLLPNPCDTFEQALRYEHRDVHALPKAELWSELRIVRHELARRIFYRRDRAYGLVDGGFRTERQWLQEREKRLSSELRKRER